MPLQAVILPVQPPVLPVEPLLLLGEAFPDRRVLAVEALVGMGLELLEASLDASGQHEYDPPEESDRDAEQSDDHCIVHIA